MQLYQEFFLIIQEFEKQKILYSVVGGIAMAFHNHPRFTRDIDFLISPDEIKKVKKILENLGYFESAPPWTFKKINLILNRFMKIEAHDYLVIDVLLGNEPRYQKIIESSLKEEWNQGVVKIATKEDLIWMKQLRNSDQDRVDIRKLSHDEDRKSN